MSGSCRAALLDMREALSVVREWSRDLPGFPEVGRRPSWMSGSCREALPDLQEWSVDPPGCPAELGVPPKCPGVVGRPS